ARAPYDETINHIADIFDEAAKDLPAKRSGSEYGRATSVIAKSIKARMLLYAASPLYNGGGKFNSSYYQGFTTVHGITLITSEYGRATSVIAKSIKARMLLYAASPLYNGGGKSNSSYYEGFTNDDGTQLIPTEYDPEKWKRAANAAKDAIDAAESVGHTLFYG